ncbi:hypothetical protein C8F04DRAFT_348060 [Mycena alexandri]|uniref:Uncharacterized protein n=1 Tax=Mycena alexandri TaxID=1745969 RepID=A0AAD6T5E7_9AGAR|nr:hypothetical protein C8F04DRAFT_348060 [Mycena alexandri]
MPHKRAKRSIRDEQRSKKGSDLAPARLGGGGDALSSEPLPKSFTRVLNAAQVRADYRAKRKLREDGDGEDGPKKAKKRKLEVAEAKIRPGETLAHFNKRIETDMRPLVRSAVQTSLATVRAERKKPASGLTIPSRTSKPSTTAPNAKSTAINPNSNSKLKAKVKAAADDSDDDPPVDKHASRPKEFARTSSAAPRRLNDIALAPPELSALARKATTKSSAFTTKGSGVLSPAQQLQMAAAREAAVARYREMKAAKRAAGEGGGGERGGGMVGEGEE